MLCFKTMQANSQPFRLSCELGKLKTHQEFKK